MSLKMSVVTLAVLIAAFTSAHGASSPPPPEQSALLARYIVNQADWASVATISTGNATKGYPFVQLISTSDGVKGKGSGIPYLYITPLDFTGQDLKKDNRVTLLMSLAQGSYCVDKGYDPMDPRCARVILSGRIKKVLKGDRNYGTAKKAVYERHRWIAENAPANHHFYIGELKIERIALLAKIGGPAYITVNDYLNAKKKIY